MKKVYAMLFVSLFAIGASAQHVMSPYAKGKDKEMKRANNSQTQVNTDREVFYTNDFSDCSDFVIDNAYDNGYTQFVSDLNFECGDVLPEGPAAIDPVASTTADNGFMMIDSDEYGGEEGFDGIENSWFQTVDPINCADHPFVSLSFETFYRMWDNGSSDGNEYCLVEVSRDGVTWPDVETFEVSEGMVDFGDGDGMVQARWELWPEMQTQDPVDNPTLFVFDITSAAGGQDEVWIRFRWKGTWGYAWMVDDMELFDTPENDIRFDSYATYTDYNGTFMYEVDTWHPTQATEVQMAAKVRNIGSLDQTNVTLNASINGNDAGTSDAIDLPYLASDTLRITGYTVPTDPGQYDIEFTVSADAEDENPGDNVTTQSFQVAPVSYDENNSLGGQYGRDDRNFSGLFPAATYNDEFQAATPMQFFGDGTIYSIQVAVTAGDEGAPMICHVLDFENLEIQASTAELELNPALLNDGTESGDDIIWYNFILEDPWPVAEGEGWVASFESYGGSGIRIGESKFAPDQTCFVFGDFGTAGFDWYFTNETPMIRFNMDEGAAVENMEQFDTFAISQNAPNPASDFTRITYNLEVAAEVAIEVRDITGKLMMTRDLGTVGAGSYAYDLSVADYAAGMYSYTFTVNGKTVTRKMIVK
ncbi:T9SS type A sorting domain-containing protein [Sanyastnella coralliicola]|uniref:T9SS type A sorting domain-containing protein n=1 Tax=Sanyastnella coralliicola TaxID=3069118 RepID=UPI0027B952A7|nr:T9SS type A sorting domain-containing protein [Longitalea sp. SCSIO 12813]